jgi:hypothetical protein
MTKKIDLPIRASIFSSSNTGEAYYLPHKIVEINYKKDNTCGQLAQCLAHRKYTENNDNSFYY